MGLSIYGLFSVFGVNYGSLVEGRDGFGGGWGKEEGEEREDKEEDRKSVRLALEKLPSPLALLW